MNHARQEKVGKYLAESHLKSCSQILYYDQDYNRDGCEREQNWYSKLAPEIQKNLEVVKPEVDSIERQRLNSAIKYLKSLSI